MSLKKKERKEKNLNPYVTVGLFSFFLFLFYGYEPVFIPRFMQIYNIILIYILLEVIYIELFGAGVAEHS